MDRHKDWLKQAHRKLESAKWDLKGEFWEDATFCAQQTAELAVKALLIAKRLEHRGHMVSLMLEKLNAPDKILEFGMRLDHHYTNSRYPDAYDTGAPMAFYNKSMAEEAIKYAEEIIEYIESELGKL